jgi:cytidyltransferase-like protein
VNVLTLGTFDLFHAGHVAFLRRCRELAGNGRVTVGLNTDRFAESYKRAPAIEYSGRQAVVSACRYVDAVVPNDQVDGNAWDVVELVDPDVIAATEDWRDRNWFAQVGMPEAELLRMGVRVEWIPYTDGVSSTAIREQLVGAR